MQLLLRTLQKINVSFVYLEEIMRAVRSACAIPMANRKGFFLTIIKQISGRIIVEWIASLQNRMLQLNKWIHLKCNSQQAAEFFYTKNHNQQLKREILIAFHFNIGRILSLRIPNWHSLQHPETQLPCCFQKRQRHRQGRLCLLQLFFFHLRL